MFEILSKFIEEECSPGMVEWYDSCPHTVFVGEKLKTFETKCRTYMTGGTMYIIENIKKLRVSYEMRFINTSQKKIWIDGQTLILIRWKTSRSIKGVCLH